MRHRGGRIMLFERLVVWWYSLLVAKRLILSGRRGLRNLTELTGIQVTDVCESWVVVRLESSWLTCILGLIAALRTGLITALNRSGLL